MSSSKSALQKSISLTATVSNTHQQKCLDITDHFYSMKAQCEIGIKKSISLIALLRRIAKIFNATGDKISKTIEKGLVDIINIVNEKKEDEEQISQIAKSLRVLANNYFSFSDLIEEKFLAKYADNIEKLKNELEELSSLNYTERNNLRTLKTEVINFKKMAMKKIIKTYKYKTYDESPKRKVMTLSFKLKIPFSKDTSNGNEAMILRTFNIKSCQFNNNCTKYYSKILPDFIKEIKEIEEKRILSTKDVEEMLPLCFSFLEKENMEGITESISKLKKRDSFSLKPQNKYIFTDKKDSDIFSMFKETYIDKRSEIMKLKINKNDIFDASLEELMTFPHNKGRKIPLSIHNVVEHIIENSIETEGIFRISASTKEVEKFTALYTSASSFCIYADLNVHVVTCYLKKFIKQLPESLIPISINSRLINITALYKEKNDKSTLKAIREFEQILKKIPQINKNVIEYISNLLMKVSNSSSENKMTKENLGIIFSPSLFPSVEGNLKEISDYISVGKILVEFIIENYNEINWNV